MPDPGFCAGASGRCSSQARGRWRARPDGDHFLIGSCPPIRTLAGENGIAPHDETGVTPATLEALRQK